MDSHSVLGLLTGPTVLCIGTTTEQFAALAEASDGSMVMLYLPDSQSAMRLLTSDPAVAAVPAIRRPAEAPAHRVCTPLHLSAREFDLLFALSCDPGRVWTFAELTTQVWSRPYLGDTDAVVSAVKRLRSQVKQVTGSVLIESIRGVGYRMVVADDG